MEPRDERRRGILSLALGVAAVGFLVALLFGATTEGGDLDWVDIPTAGAGSVLAVGGLYFTLRHRRTGQPHTGPHPQAAS